MLVLLAATLAAYHPAWHGGLLWDDDAHVTRAELRSVSGLWRIWFDVGSTQQYYPVVHSAFWALYRLFGDATFGYHIVTISLHALSALLVAVILRRLAVPGAVLAAVVFALHPVHVESVAWITELKNTLSGVCYLGAALAYLRFDERRERRWYGVATFLFVMALLSKSVTATLPAALLVVFWWQRGRLRWHQDVLPLAPWLALGAAAGTLTAWVERTFVGAQGAGFELTLVERFLIAGRAIWFYLGKLVRPADLTFIYPKWHIDHSDATQYLYPLGIIVLLAALWLVRARSRAPLAALLFFCGTLFPALGFFNVYPFRYSFVADHFQYLASIGIITLLSAGAATVIIRWRTRPRWAAGLLLVATGTSLGVMTWRQSRHYRDAETLYLETLRRNPAATMAAINVALLYLDGPPEKWGQAASHLETAVRLDPANSEALVNLGAALQKTGRLEEAARRYEEALRLKADDVDAYTNLGSVRERLGRLEEATGAYREAVRLAPGSSETHANLGRVLLTIDRRVEAEAAFREALKRDPRNGVARYLLGTALRDMGRVQEAVVEYNEALRDQKLAGTAEVHNDLGVALARLGQLDQAAVQFKEALRLDPGFDAARANLQMATGR